VIHHDHLDIIKFLYNKNFDVMPYTINTICIAIKCYGIKVLKFMIDKGFDYKTSKCKIIRTLIKSGYYSYAAELLSKM